MSVEARLQLRKEKSQPYLEDLHDWLIKTRVNTAGGGTSAKALDHILKRWPAIIRYAETGYLPIDNNPVENAIRPIALGKRIGYSLVPSGLENGRQQYNPCWARLS